MISKACFSALIFFKSGKGASIVHELGNCILDYGCCCKLEQSSPADTRKFTSKDMVAIAAGTLYHEDPSESPSEDRKVG